MAKKLKNLHLTSVDLVRAGANQEADICLFKSADHSGATEDPTESETNIFKRFINWLRENPTEGEYEPHSHIEKAEEPADPEDIYKTVMKASIESIIDDDTLTPERKKELAEESIEQYHEKMKEHRNEDNHEWDDDDRYDEIEEVTIRKPDTKKSKVEKFNQNHDSSGKFSSTGGGGGASILNNPSGGREVLFSDGRGQRNHAEIVDKLPEKTNQFSNGYAYIGQTKGNDGTKYDLYHDRDSQGQFSYLAMKESASNPVGNKILPKNVGKSARFDEIEEIEKFNPYHGYHGYFSGANNATSMTVHTNSAAGQKAIANIRERERQQAAGGGGSSTGSSQSTSSSKYKGSGANGNWKNWKEGDEITWSPKDAGSKGVKEKGKITERASDHSIVTVPGKNGARDMNLWLDSDTAGDFLMQ